MAIEVVLYLGILIHAYLIHIAYPLSFSLIFIEGLIITLIGFIALAITKNPHAKLTGRFYNDFMIEPIDVWMIGVVIMFAALIFMLVGDYLLLSFTPLAFILPWTISAQYREFNEIFWMFHYWISMNAAKGKFSNKIPYIFLKNKKFYPAIHTHYRVAAFTLLLIFNLLVLFNL